MTSALFSRERKTVLAEWWWTIDRELLAALLLLLGVGIALSFAASPPVAERLGLGSWYFVGRHVVFALAAMATLIGISFLNARQARILALVTLVVSLLALFATLRFGYEIKGAKRWLMMFGQSIQPSEFVKPAFAVVASWLFAERMQHADLPGRLISMALLGAILVPLLLQPDVGQTALVAATFMALLFMTGISWWLIFGLLGVGVAGSIGAYLVFPHVAKRIDAFLDPAGGGNYQAEKAVQSLLEGGWFGRGPGEALTKRVLPDAHADYVFAAAAGEFGIIFCLMLVALIGFIVVRILLAAQGQSALFNRLAASVLGAQFAAQATINLAVNLDLVPPKGMTLPFVSYGGTSMIAVALGMGLMLALTRRRPQERYRSGLPAYRLAATPEGA